MLKQIICQFNSFQRFFIAIVSKLSHKLLSSSLCKCVWDMALRPNVQIHLAWGPSRISCVSVSVLQSSVSCSYVWMWLDLARKCIFCSRICPSPKARFVIWSSREMSSDMESNSCETPEMLSDLNEDQLREIGNFGLELFDEYMKDQSERQKAELNHGSTKLL